MLLEHNALASARDAGNYTPLHRACYWEKKDIILALVRARADLQARNHCGKDIWLDMNAKTGFLDVQVTHHSRFLETVQIQIILDTEKLVQ